MERAWAGLVQSLHGTIPQICVFDTDPAQTFGDFGGGASLNRLASLTATLQLRRFFSDLSLVIRAVHLSLVTIVVQRHAVGYGNGD